MNEEERIKIFVPHFYLWKLLSVKSGFRRSWLLFFYCLSEHLVGWLHKAQGEPERCSRPTVERRRWKTYVDILSLLFVTKPLSPTRWTRSLRLITANPSGPRQPSPRASNQPCLILPPLSSPSLCSPIRAHPHLLNPLLDHFNLHPNWPWDSPALLKGRLFVVLCG